MVRYLLLVCLVLIAQLVCKICAEADGLNSISVTESQTVVMNIVIAQDPSITSNPNQVTIRAIPDYNISTAKPMHKTESIQISSIPTKADDATIASNNSNDKTTFQSTETNPTNGVFPIPRKGNSLYCKIFNILSGEYRDAPITYTLSGKSELLLKRSLLCTMNGILINRLFH